MKENKTNEDVTRKKDLEEIEKWKNAKKQDIINTYGFDITELADKEDMKKIDSIAMISDKAVKFIVRLSIIAIIGCLVLIAGLLIYVYGSADSKANDYIESNLASKYGMEFKVISKEFDEENTGYIRIKSRQYKKLEFTLIMKPKEKNDDFIDNSIKYCFENWKSPDKSKIVVAQQYDGQGLLKYILYIQTSDENETKTIYNEFKEYAGELYKSEWDNHILNKK